MMAKRRTEIMEQINNLKSRLEDWRTRPIVPEVVRDIGVRAISEEISRVSRELRLDDIHHSKY